MDIPKHIFKTYDIRGLIDGELSSELAERLGRAVVVFTRAKTVVVGRDMRETSPEFAKAVIEGVTKQGADVIDVGMCSTPMFNFAVTQYDEPDVGIMVTASHNPVEYNGFKMTLSNGLAIGKGSGMDEIREMVATNEFSDAETVGKVSTREIAKAYLDKVFSLTEPIPSMKDLTIVVDAGNGMGGMLVEDFFSRLDCTWHGMYLDPDGSFPNHEANPIKESTLDDLRKKMKEVNADIGIGYDGDGDRVGFVDEEGGFVRGDHVVGMLVGEILRKHGGAGTVFYDLRATRLIVDAIKDAGGTPKMSEVGHANFKRHLLEEGGENITENRSF